jgi:hypothetical protein
MRTPPPPPWAGWWDPPRRFTQGGQDMRVSDAERNEIGEILSRHYSDGRLDENEFRERLDRAMSAKTRADFAGLTADLPRLDLQVTPPVPPRHRSWFFVVPIVFGLLVASAIWSALFSPHIPWILLAIVLVVLLRRRHWSRVHYHQHHRHGQDYSPPASNYM